eukprot:1041163-Prorocentrum_minimum.AAC.3
MGAKRAADEEEAFPRGLIQTSAATTLFSAVLGYPPSDHRSGLEPHMHFYAPVLNVRQVAVL